MTNRLRSLTAQLQEGLTFENCSEPMLQRQRTGAVPKIEQILETYGAALASGQPSQRR